MTNLNQRTRLHPIQWLAALSVTGFSALGIAAIAGWLPSATGHQEIQTESRMAAAEAGRQAAPVEPAAKAAAKTQVAPESVGTAASAATPPACPECGTIVAIRPVEAPVKPSGVGAIAGGVIGGVLGNQVGKGSGRDLATIGGAVLGGFAGNQVEKKTRTTTHYEVSLRLDSGEYRLLRLSHRPQWQEGERVALRDGALYPPRSAGG